MPVNPKFHFITFLSYEKVLVLCEKHFRNFQQIFTLSYSMLKLEKVNIEIPFPS